MCDGGEKQPTVKKALSIILSQVDRVNYATLLGPMTARVESLLMSV